MIPRLNAELTFLSDDDLERIRVSVPDGCGDLKIKVLDDDDEKEKDVIKKWNVQLRMLYRCGFKLKHAGGTMMYVKDTRTL